MTRIAMTKWEPKTEPVLTSPGYILLTPVCDNCGGKTFSWIADDDPFSEIKCRECGVVEAEDDWLLDMMQAPAPGEEPALLQDTNGRKWWWYVEIPQRRSRPNISRN
jgi:hypothetical protein